MAETKVGVPALPYFCEKKIRGEPPIFVSKQLCVKSKKKCCIGNFFIDIDVETRKL